MKYNTDYKKLNSYEEQARIFIKNFIVPKIEKTLKEGDLLKFIPTETNCVIDGIIKIWNPETNYKKVFIIEIKVRERIFSNYMLEKDKYNSICKYVEDYSKFTANVIPLYINITPTGTLFYNTDKLENIIWQVDRFNKTTCSYKQEKIDKIVTYLEINQADKYYPEITNKNFFNI